MNRKPMVSEERAFSSLCRAIFGQSVLDLNPAEQAVLVQVAVSAEAYTGIDSGDLDVIRSASHAVRLQGVLAHPYISSDILRDVVLARTQEFRALPGLRMVIGHPACTPRIAVSVITPLWAQLNEASLTDRASYEYAIRSGNSYARAAAYIALRLSAAPEIMQGLALELGQLGDEGFETFKALLSDKLNDVPAGGRAKPHNVVSMSEAIASAAALEAEPHEIIPDVPDDVLT